MNISDTFLNVKKIPLHIMFAVRYNFTMWVIECVTDGQGEFSCLSAYGTYSLSFSLTLYIVRHGDHVYSVLQATII